MLGQETLSSSAPTPPSASNRCATSAYSSTVVPQMLMMVGTFSVLRNGQYFLMNPSTPGPCKPMALISPLATSTVRGVGLPRTGMQPDAFHDDRAELVQVEQLRVFDAVAERAGGDHHRVLQRQLADLDGQIHECTSELENRENIQHSTSNTEHRRFGVRRHNWMLDVRCWMFDVSSS